MFEIIKDKTMPKIKETKGKKDLTLSKTKVAISLGLCAIIAIAISPETTNIVVT